MSDVFFKCFPQLWSPRWFSWKAQRLGESLVPPSPHYLAAGVQCSSPLLLSHPLSSFQTLSELPRGITMGKTWQQTVHLLWQKSDFVYFAFLRRWNTWRIREITSPNQQTSYYSTAQTAREATVRPRCLALPKVMGQNILSAFFLYFVWLDCPCRHCSSERKFSKRQTEIFMAGHTFNSHL